MTWYGNEHGQQFCQECSRKPIARQSCPIDTLWTNCCDACGWRPIDHLRGQLASAASMPLWWSLSKKHMIAAANLLDGLRSGSIQPILDALRDEFSPEVIAALEWTYAAIRPMEEADARREQGGAA